MHQPDISNLENANKGSGITDILKLSDIAKYLGISLEYLLFGKMEDKMEKYQGEKMNIAVSEERLPEKRLKL
ncbi:MAG: hypothetical protein K6D94_07525, partial [Clostridiales bacterium]|nr:hypothetical protein [Clostridiales bacterium]